jgi:YHS domain-containing protein
MKTCLSFLLLLSVMALTPSLLPAQDRTAERTKQFNLNSGLALQGYDPVAYLTDKKAVKGNPSYKITQQGVTYHFASAAHRDLFSKNPAKYEPAFGGWCAYALGATGEKVDIDPKTFKVVDGKVYLFYNAYFNNTLPKWNAAESSLKPKAHTAWKKYFAE